MLLAQLRLKAQLVGVRVLSAELSAPHSPEQAAYRLA